MGVLLGIVHWIIALPLLGFTLVTIVPVGLFLLFGALIPAAIAKSKDRSFWLWYAYGVNLWIVALIHALVLSRPPQRVIVEYRDRPETD
ncbi:MAG: hypothetical protein AAF739_00440 [Pseudomonadota bacterium]